jgi:ABC-2 type transport system permease protein
MHLSDVNRTFFRGVIIIAEKDMRIYYTKPPVLMFGFLFPAFMFLAFSFGREADLHTVFPGLLAMFVFFISSSVGPLITPWEKRAGTYERLLSFPVDTNTIILGDVVAGMLYGAAISVIILIVGTAFLGYSVSIMTALLSLVGIVLGAFCFSSLGVLLASPSTSTPSNVMILSNLIRFPLIFVSGIFVPLTALHGISRIATYCSPITYLVDLFTFSLRGVSALSLSVDFTILIAFSAVFVVLSGRFHEGNRMKGL